MLWMTYNRMENYIVHDHFIWSDLDIFCEAGINRHNISRFENLPNVTTCMIIAAMVATIIVK